MTKYLMIGAITALIGGLVLGLAPLVLLSILFFIFAALEHFQTRREREMLEWEEEDKDENTIDDWHRRDYEQW